MAAWFLSFGALGLLCAPPAARDPPPRVAGRLSEISPADGGVVLSLSGRGAEEQRVFIPRTGDARLDAWPSGATLGAWVAAPLKGQPTGRRAVVRGLSLSTLEVRTRARLWDLVVTLPARLRQPFRARAEARLACGADQASALLLANVSGDDRRIDGDSWEILRASGLAHIAVVSGFNVAVVAMALGWCAAPLGGRGHPSRRAAVLAGVVLLTVVLPADPPVRRAAIALLIASSGRLVGRGAPPATALAGAVVLLLAWDPRLAVSLSFILTVAATGAIIRAAAIPGWWGKVWTFAAPTFATWPVLVEATGRVSPWAVAANFLALPAAPVAICAGWVAVALPAGWIGSAIPLRVARVAAGWVLRVAGEAALWPASGALAATTNRAWLVADLLVLVGLLGARRPGVRACLLVLLLACSAWPLRPSSPPASPPRVEVLDVGQGQAVLLEPGGDPVLVDAADDRSPEGARALLAALRRRGVRRLATLVITHADRDHAGGAGIVLAAAPPARIVAPRGARFSASLAGLLDKAERRRRPVLFAAAGDAWSEGRATIRVLHPGRDATGDGNDGALVLRVDLGGMSGVLPSDAPARVEERLARRGLLTPADFLIAGHHGARTCTSPDLLERLSPAAVLISCGRRNTHGHPHKETLERIAAAGAAWLSTAREGALGLRLEGERRLVIEVDGSPARVLPRWASWPGGRRRQEVRGGGARRSSGSEAQRDGHERQQQDQRRGHGQ